jgi:hypothetical protein
VVLVCGGFVQLCANFENQVCPKILSFLLAICAYYGVEGGQESQLASRGVPGYRGYRETIDICPTLS